MRPLRRVGAFAAVAALALLSGCSAGLSESGEPLTQVQAEQLAQARFALSTADTFTAEIRRGDPDDVDHEVADVTVDTVRHRAWGTRERGPADLAVSEEIAFSPDAVATRADGGQWQVVPVDAAASGAFGVVFGLVADRPENSQLLQQSDARHLGRAEVDGDECDVYRLPTAEGAGDTSTRLWLDETGAVRRLDTGDDALVVTIPHGDSVAPPPELDEMLGTDDRAAR